MSLTGINIQLTSEQLWQEEVIKLTYPDPLPTIIPAGHRQRFMVNGRLFKIYSPIWKRDKQTLQYTVLAYWIGEVTDDPAPYFTKSVTELHRLNKEGKLKWVL